MAQEKCFVDIDVRGEPFPIEEDVTVGEAESMIRDFLAVTGGWIATVENGRSIALGPDILISSIATKENPIPVLRFVEKPPGNYETIRYSELLQMTRFECPTGLLENLEEKLMGPGLHSDGPWLKVALPRAEKVVPFNLVLPVPSNPFYVTMMQSDSGQKLLDKLRSFTLWEEGNKHHVLLVGSSGCGKTSAAFALAAERYVVYLECPLEGTGAVTDPGYRMSRTWRGSFKTDLHAYRLFNTEVAARLLVLRQLLEQFGSRQMTPLRWLLFVLSNKGAAIIANVFRIIRCLDVTSGFVGGLLTDISRLTPGIPRVVLIVDELQTLVSNFRMPAANSATAQISTTRALQRAAHNMPLSVVFTGTRMGDITQSNESSVAKYLSGELKLQAVGDFQYLQAEDISRLFNHIFDHRASSAMLAQVCHLLQGRARILVSFVNWLVEPTHADWKEPLDDVVLGRELENYVQMKILLPFSREIEVMVKNHLLSKEDLEHVWVMTMISKRAANNSPPLEVGKCRSSSLAFTRSVAIALDVANAGKPVKYTYEHVYGEPCLQEALLRKVWANDISAKSAIASLLRTALSASSLGSNLDYAMGLLFLARRKTIVADLCRDHERFDHCKDWCLTANRIVKVSTAEEQLEWLTLLIDSPDRCDFSLLPGVPVKNIAILPCNNSGVDLICVATPGEEAVKDDRGVFNVNGKRTRGQEEEERKEAVARTAPMALVQVSCATRAGGVDNAKHLKDVVLSNRQFEGNKGDESGAKYWALEAECVGSNQFRRIPVIVEVPCKEFVDIDYVHVSDENAVTLMGQEAVDLLVDRSGVIG